MKSSTIDELKSAWNAQADRMNQWDELGLDEIVDFAQRRMLNRIAELEALRASPVYGRTLRADAERIVAATVGACANECERQMMFPGGRQMSYAHHGVHAAAQGIRAITPEQILSGLAASQQPADHIADSGEMVSQYMQSSAAQSGEKQ